MRRTKRAYLLIISLGLFVGNVSHAAPPPTSMDIGGIINNHDMMMLREKQRWYTEDLDFENFNNKKNETEQSVINDQQTAVENIELSEKIFNKDTHKTLQEELIQAEVEKEKKKFFKKKKKSKSQEFETGILEAEVEHTAPAIEEENPDAGKVYIKAVKISESKVFTDFELQNFLDPIIDKKITFEDLQDVIDSINFAYATRGFVTAKAYVPPQTLSNNIIKISLLEGTVGNLSISNNKYTSSSFIEKRLPVKEGDVLQIVELEKSLVKFNKYNPGIRLNANLAKGQKLGTTDIKVVAQEKFPFRVMALMDNAGRHTIGELRGGMMLYSDSLFKQRDKLTIGSYVSRHSVTPFADYNIPVNKYDGRVGFLFSNSYSEIARGPYKMFDISSRSFNYSLYYSHPLIRKNKFELVSYTAANYKQGTTSFFDYEINKDQVTSFETALNARYETKRGIWYATQGVYHAFPIFDKNSNYFKYTGNIVRLHDFGHGIVGQFKGMYQYSPDDVMPYIDQFQAGGIATVRGYSEGLLIGRTGYLLSAELMFPILPSDIPIKKAGEKKKLPFLGRYVKGITFVDHAGIYPYKGYGPGVRSYNKNDYMVSTGLGLRVTLPADASARLYWGYPLMHNDYERDVKHPRFSFELSLAPDFDKILSLKRRKQQRDSL